MNTQALNDKQKSIIIISAFTANGNMDKLTLALNHGLDSGLAINEIKEILVQLYVYTGSPRSLNGIDNFMDVVNDRQTKGIKDVVGKEATPMPANFDRDKYGAEMRAKITGHVTIPKPAGYQLFVPIMNSFLKEHLFCDIFYRDSIDWQSRGLATISALSTLNGVEKQLQFYMNGAMNLGLTESQLIDFINELKDKVGDIESDRAERVLKKVLETRK